MQIPAYLNRDDYLQNPIMRRFLRDKKIEFVETRADYIKAIEDYANSDIHKEAEVKEWLFNIAKEGSKDFCYRKITGISESHRDATIIEARINERYPDCPMQNLINFTSTGERRLCKYNIIKNECGDVTKIEFVFSTLMLYGTLGEEGNDTVFPVFVEVYLEDGFVVSRAKAKSTVYKYDANNKMLFSEYRENTMEYARVVMDEIIDLFEFQTERDSKIVKTKNSQMLYKLYQEYSFTPSDVEEKVNTMEVINKAYVDKIFEELGLSIRNKEKALLDIKIFVEKFISINGNNEELFKNDRGAYLIKVGADDEIELTKIDTTSDKTVPLQCTEAFFDSKKSIIKSKKCNKLTLIFKRNNPTYFKSSPLVVQFGTNKNYGYFKTTQYAEEADIQNVLQAIFKHY